MLLDLQLQDGSGIEVCRAVRAIKPSVSGLLLTAAGDDEALAAAVLAGAAGYLVKLSRSADIVGAIRRVRSEAPLLDDRSVLRARRLLSSIMESLSPPLTEDERRILEHLIDGQTNSQVAETLGGSHEQRPEINGLVARVAQALLDPTGRPGEPGAGRHRRAD
jgi:two-component system response regulator DevR